MRVMGDMMIRLASSSAPSFTGVNSMVPIDIANPRHLAV
jgi:hypothetical protein